MQGEFSSLNNSLIFLGCIIKEKVRKSEVISLFWIENISILFISQRQHYIDVIIERDNYRPWRFIGFYGQAPFMETLKRIQSLSTLPRLVEGDFSTVWENQVVCKEAHELCWSSKWPYAFVD